MKLSIGYHSRNDEPLPKNLMQESQNDKPQPTLYELIGGNDKLRELVDRFYDLMDLETEFAALRAMHAKGVKRRQAKTKTKPRAR